jgi:hypothetical protein
VAAAEEAVKAMRPVTVGVGTTESRVGVNRRQLMRNNKITLGHNLWGVYDPVMTVISFADESGKAVANIVHYGAHCTAAGVNHEITRDWAGVMVDRMETETGAVTLYLNGTQGDVAPRTASGRSAGRSIREAMEVGGMAAVDAMRAFRAIQHRGTEPLAVAVGPVEVPYLPATPEAEVREWLAAAGEGWSFKRFMYEQLIDLYDAGHLGPDNFSFTQTIVRIGPVALVPYPFETLSEIGLRLREYSPYAHTLLLSCTNGSNSYLPAQGDLVRGGYEVDSFYGFRPRRLPDDTDRYTIEANLKLMEQL